MAEAAQENAGLVQRGYELFNSGDLEALKELFDPNAVWHVGGRGRLSGEKRGHHAILAYFQELGQLSGGTFRADMHDVVAGGEHVVGLHSSSGRRDGRQINLHTAILFHLRDGKIAEAWEHYQDSQTWDEFLA